MRSSFPPGIFPDFRQTGLVVVGFSGGADSTALAHWLTTKISPERIILAHVNHLLRGKEAEQDEAAAGAFAQIWQKEHCTPALTLL